MTPTREMHPISVAVRAALYLRSSKDRHDVSIDAQRRDLTGLAKARSLRIVQEFADAVESGKDDDREGFRALIAAIRNPRRGWSTVLVLDTSRIARRRHIATFFEEECRKHGVAVVYKTMPEADPVTDTLLKGIMQALDEWHSLTSREKGLAGMRENVRKGFRAGGRAPLGYRLEAVDTGATREGQPVRKSRLAVSADAPLVRAYLQARAQGVPRGKCSLPGVTKSSLVGIEWNALTYAGHTVWNVHAEAGSGQKRRPRSDWLIQRDTHEALITDAEAEAIVARLEAWGPNRERHRDAGYLLAGLLVTPDGRRYEGDRGSYRVKGRYARAAEIDAEVASAVLRDIQSPGFVRTITRAARATRTTDEAKPLREALRDVERRLERLLGLIEQTTTPAPLLRQMEALEVERARMAAALVEVQADVAEREALSQIGEIEVRRMLVQRAEQLAAADLEQMRVALQAFVDRVEFDGEVLDIHYRFGRPGRAAEPAESRMPPASATASGRVKDGTPWGRHLKPAAIAVTRRHRVA